jgi:LPS-assembly protein
LKILSLCAALIFGLVPVLSGQVPGSTIPVEITADQNSYLEGLATAEGNVIIRYGDDVIYADQASYDRDTREVVATGNVRIFAKGKVYRGEFLTYNLAEGRLTSKGFRTIEDRLYAAGEEIESPRDGMFRINSGYITTDNVENPAFRVQAKTIEIYPDDRVVLKNVVLKVGDIPVFWLPYVSQSLKDEQGSLSLDVGSNSRLGFYIIPGYNWSATRALDIGVYGAYYTRRGFGGGVLAEYEPTLGNKFNFKSFNIWDEGTNIGVNPVTRPVKPDESRYRYTYRHRLDLSEDFTSTADFNILSDRNVDEDFFVGNFERDVQPDNYMDVMFYNPNFTGTLLTRVQINSLYEVVERKPEFLIEIKRQKLFSLPISYEGETSISNLNRKFDRDEPVAAALQGRPVRMPYGGYRWDSYHQFLYPRQYFNWLSFTPRLGFRGTAYDYYSGNSPLLPDAQGSFGRFSVNTGFDLSFKISKTWGDYKNEKWGIDGLRHVAEPFMEYSYTPDPLGRDFQDFDGFDDRLPSTRAQPLSFSGYNSIDSIGRMNVLRQGVRNKLQTRRDGLNVDLVDWKIYGDLNIDPRNDFAVAAGLPGYSRALFPQVYNEIAVQPLPWLRYDLYANTKVVSSGITEVTNNLSWQALPSLELRGGYSYLENINRLIRGFPNSNLVTTGMFWRVNEDWQFEGSLGFEIEDGTLQDQRYTIYRDFRTWNSALTVFARQNKAVQDEFGVFLTFTLKAFPSTALSISN